MNQSMLDELIEAIASAKPVTLEEIIGSGIDINASGANTRRTALAAAAFAGNCSLIRSLVKHGADLHQDDRYGMTAVHEAASMGHEDAVRTLLDLGADLESKTSYGNTALMMAAACGNCDVVRLLLARGADINHCDNRGDTALMIAEEKGEEQAAEILREHSKRESERTVESNPGLDSCCD